MGAEIPQHQTSHSHPTTRVSPVLKRTPRMPDLRLLLSAEMETWPNAAQQVQLKTVVLEPLMDAQWRASMYRMLDIAMHFIAIVGPLTAAIITGIAQNNRVSETQRDDIILATCILTTIAAFVIGLRPALNLNERIAIYRSLFAELKQQLDNFVSGNGPYEHVSDKELRFKRFMTISHALLLQSGSTSRVAVVVLPSEQQYYAAEAHRAATAPVPVIGNQRPLVVAMPPATAPSHPLPEHKAAH
jgi:hypothetical protein